jgi:hypothetical protein
MRITFVLIVLCLLMSGAAHAQDDSGMSPATPTARMTPAPEATADVIALDRPRAVRAEVQVESAFVRARPSEDAEAVASVFEDEIVEVIGRNLDGSWFEIRRPGRMTNLGWIFNQMLDWDFNPEYLPLTDLSTGLVGESLDRDPGFAVFLLENANLRRLPLIQETRVGLVPIGSTVPVLQRNQDGSWVFVNYLGVEGWISNYSTRPIPNVLDVPIAPGLPPLVAANIVIIPPEIQQAQLDRIRAYVNEQNAFAVQLASFWFNVAQGDIMPCSPPPFVSDYLYTAQDVRELPELQRYVPRLETANQYLNTSIELLTVCGAFDVDVIRVARNNAINAQNIYDATVGFLDNVEALID